MLLKLVVDNLIDRGHDVALQVGDLLLPLYVIVDDAALLE